MLRQLWDQWEKMYVKGEKWAVISLGIEFRIQTMPCDKQFCFQVLS